MLTYTPGIHDFTVMSERTRKALQALWDSHPSHPCLQQIIHVGNKISGGTNLGSFSVVTPAPEHDGLTNEEADVTDLFDELNLNQAAQTLNEEILSEALYAAMIDKSLTNFPEDFMRQTDGLASTYGILILMIMPGCVFLYHPLPDEACTEMIEDDMCDDHCGMWNLGIFAAGPTQSAHQKMAALGAVKATKPAWSPLINYVNAYEHSRVKILEPRIHPDRIGYCDNF